MDSFSDTYVQARQQFIDAANAKHFRIQSKVHPLRGPDQEALATDVVVLGNPQALRVLYVTSGVHGVEGYYGSGVIVEWLRDGWLPPKNTKVILVHACNPYGFAWGRRFTEENVDLNRNFWPLTQHPADNPNYRQIQHLVEYPAADRGAFARCQLEREEYLQQYGSASFKIALSSGQQHSPQGLFFAGTKPTWARHTYETLVQQHTRGSSHVFFLDLHTGLGPHGYADFLHQYPSGSNELAILKRYIGERVLGNQRDDATAQGLDGTTFACFNRFSQQLGYSVLGGAIECGTTPLTRTLEALLQETALYRHGCDDPALAARIRQELKDVFYVNTDDWKQQVFTQTCEIRDSAINYLAEQ